MRLSPQQRHASETRIRQAMDRLLRGDLPPGGKCDIKTLAREAGIDRTAFYGTRPYTRLREEFENRLHTIRQAGNTPDTRDAQIGRQKDEINALRERLTRHIATIAELTSFRTAALSRIAAQHDEITRLRRETTPASIRPAPRHRTAPPPPGNTVIPITPGKRNHHTATHPATPEPQTETPPQTPHGHNRTQ
jgi:hypothetical protein